MPKLLLLATLLLTSLFSSQIAIVKKVSGSVFIKQNELVKNIGIGDKLSVGDILITKGNSSVGFIFHDGTIVSLGENSIMKINQYIFEPIKSSYDVDLDMQKGLGSFESGKIGKLAPEAVKFRVPEGIVGIRGTKFYVEVK